MDDLKDIFIYTEGPEQVAYQNGQEIARMNTMGQERFVTALFQWVRKNGTRQIWRVDPSGNYQPATELEAAIRLRN
jgi:hypothetical protein